MADKREEMVGPEMKSVVSAIRTYVKPLHDSNISIDFFHTSKQLK
jgi:hypothetical protein